MRLFGWIIGGDKDDKNNNDDGHGSKADEVPAIREWVSEQQHARDPEHFVPTADELAAPHPYVVAKVVAIGAFAKKLFDKPTYHEAHAAFVATAEKVHGYTPVYVGDGYADPKWAAARFADMRFENRGVRTDAWGRRAANGWT